MDTYTWNNIQPRLTGAVERKKGWNALTNMAKECDDPTDSDIVNLLMCLGVLAPNDDIQRVCEQAALSVALRNRMYESGYWNPPEGGELEILMADVMSDLGITDTESED